MLLSERVYKPRSGPEPRKKLPNRSPPPPPPSFSACNFKYGHPQVLVVYSGFPVLQLCGQMGFAFTPRFYVCFENFGNCVSRVLSSLHKNKDTPPPPQPPGCGQRQELVRGVACAATPHLPVSDACSFSSALSSPRPPKPRQRLRRGRRVAEACAGAPGVAGPEARSGTTPPPRGRTARAHPTRPLGSPALTERHVHLRRLGRTMKTLLKRGSCARCGRLGCVSRCEGRWPKSSRGRKEQLGGVRR